MKTSPLPDTWLPPMPQDWHVVASPMRVAALPLIKTVLEPLVVANVPPCGQLHGPVSPSRCAPSALMKTSPDAVEFVPTRVCGQSGKPGLHVPVSLSPIRVAAGMLSASPCVQVGHNSVQVNRRAIDLDWPHAFDGQASCCTVEFKEAPIAEVNPADILRGCVRHVLLREIRA